MGLACLSGRAPSARRPGPGVGSASTGSAVRTSAATRRRAVVGRPTFAAASSRRADVGIARRCASAGVRAPAIVGCAGVRSGRVRRRSLVGSASRSATGVGGTLGRAGGRPASRGTHRAILEPSRRGRLGRSARRASGACGRLGPAAWSSRISSHRRSGMGCARCGTRGLGHPQDRGTGRSAGALLGCAGCAARSGTGQNSGAAARERAAPAVERASRTRMVGASGVRGSGRPDRAGSARVNRRRPRRRRAGRARGSGRASTSTSALRTAALARSFGRQQPRRRRDHGRSAAHGWRRRA